MNTENMFPQAMHNIFERKHDNAPFTFRSERYSSYSEGGRNVNNITAKG